VEDVAHCGRLVSAMLEALESRTRTFVEAIHVELPYERRYICMFEILSVGVSEERRRHVTQSATPTQELLRIQKMAT
jgi:hypothetical protein